jgi:Flp pilus assembly pilin Flp
MEYGMIAAIIIVAIVSGVAAIGKGLPIAFNTISSAM